jgi:hypothetical protein
MPGGSSLLQQGKLDFSPKRWALQAAEKRLNEGHGFSRAEYVLRASSALAAEVRF